MHLAAVALMACAQAQVPACPSFDEARQTGAVGDALVHEASGLASSQRQPGMLWTHNDHGSDALLHALGPDGSPLGQVRLEGVVATDWEDLAIGSGPNGQPTLFVGDVGDNDDDRTDITVLRLEEPAAMAGPGAVRSVVPELLHLRHPDHAVDVEGLAVDPLTHELVLATKQKGLTRLRTANAHAAAGSTQTLVDVGSVDLSADRWKGGRKVTAIDFSPDGSRLYLRTARHVLVVPRAADETLTQALARPVCLAPAPPDLDGEALAATATGFVTTSEGHAAPLWAVTQR